MTENKATWIWYPGDFEVWLGNKFNNRRTERGAMFPPFWKQDSHWPTVVFKCQCELTADETVTIAAEGQYSLSLDGQLQYGQPREFTVPEGRHELALKVWNQQSPPAVFVDGPTIRSGSHWKATYEDKIWIDENGTAHGSGIYVPAAAWNFDDACSPPSAYRLERKELFPVSKEQILEYTLPSTHGTSPSRGRQEGAILYDFGRETFGYLKLHHLRGTVHVCYGESREEALDREHCETLDILHGGEEPGSKAFRYVCVSKEDGACYDSVTMDYEYAPFDPARSGSFRCSDDELNRIWEVAAYTLELTTREFFCDGIKRDRWIWSGDAIQSYLMNYYLHFDTECVKRTIRQLRGKDPVTTHINTIMDYTFFWFISIGDYYSYTADMKFVNEILPHMRSLMDFVQARLNHQHMAEALPGDWIFVDWTDFHMPKQGALAFQQILLYKSYKVMAKLHHAAGQESYAHHYDRLMRELHNAIIQHFWSPDECTFIHAIHKGAPVTQVNRHTNTMAIIHADISTIQSQAIRQSVFLNPLLPPITTPYMQFYELEARCMLNLHHQVLQHIKQYWGGMLQQGATTFWEKYDPDEQGSQHLAMYGRPYGKSLCHAWGAAPLYLLGRYFLGVRPTAPGYARYEVRPVLGSLQWISGQVPTPFGRINIHADSKKVTAYSDGGQGKLIVGNRKIAIPPRQEVTMKIS